MQTSPVGREILYSPYSNCLAIKSISMDENKHGGTLSIEAEVRGGRGMD